MPLGRALVLVLLTAACGTRSPAGRPSHAPPPQMARLCDSPPLSPKRQMRGAWVASVQNIDWPSQAGLSAAAQQAEFSQLADDARRIGLNALFVQIRPTADSFYDSPYEPWSQYLSGQQGQDPGYDALAFLVEGTHARNLEFHAWFNPYRISTQADPNQLVANHPARLNPTWVKPYGGKLLYDPGQPAVRAFIEKIVLDAVQRYDLDGVHFDDYFYPYPVSGQDFPDGDTFAQYGAGFTDKGAWRRHNVDLLVSELDAQIHAAKPWVRFGISPFGIWRNASTDPTGSATHGLESYSAIACDTRTWIENGWIDYVVPQVYWNIGFTAAPYEVLTPWWAITVSTTDVQLYIGQGAYRIGAAGWQDPQEMNRHLALNSQYGAVQGDVFFSVTSLRHNPLGSTEALDAGPYSRPALVPETPHLGGAAPAPVTITDARRLSGGVELSFSDVPGEAATTYYAVYRLDGEGPIEACHLASAEHLVTTVRRDAGDSHRWLDSTAEPAKVYTYVVSALDRLHHESAPSAARTAR